MTKGASLCNSYDDDDTDDDVGDFTAVAGDDASTRRNRPQIILVPFDCLFIRPHFVTSFVTSFVVRRRRTLTTSEMHEIKGKEEKSVSNQH